MPVSRGRVPLVSADPTNSSTIAQEMNVLERTTPGIVSTKTSSGDGFRFGADRSIRPNRLIERLDGGKRRSEVLQLRRLEGPMWRIDLVPHGDKDTTKRPQYNNRYSYYGLERRGRGQKEEERVSPSRRTQSHRQVLPVGASEIRMERSVAPDPAR